MHVNMNLVWLGLTVLLFIIEAAVPGLVSIWFAIGALGALLASLVGSPLWLQILWFIILSVALLLLTRPLAKKYINARVQPTNADMVIGKEAVVTEEIDNLRATGAVRVDGREWTARAEHEGSTIAVGRAVTVLRIEGVKLIVKN